MVVLVFIPLDVLPDAPTPTPSAAYPGRPQVVAPISLAAFWARHHSAGHGATQAAEAYETSATRLARTF